MTPVKDVEHAKLVMKCLSNFCQIKIDILTSGILFVFLVKANEIAFQMGANVMPSWLVAVISVYHSVMSSLLKGKALQQSLVSKQAHQGINSWPV